MADVLPYSGMSSEDSQKTPAPGGHVVEVHNLPQTKAISTTLVVITAIVIVFSIVAAIAYYSFNSTLQAKMQDREQNELLYNDPNQKDILGLEDTLPEVQIGSARAKQQQQSALQRPQNQMIQTPDGRKQVIPPKPRSTNAVPSEKPSPTEVPENVLISKDEKFSIEHEKWTKGASTSEGDTEIDILESPDGTYKLYVGVVKKKFGTVDEYLDSDPRGRKPKNGRDSITLGGETGKKANTYTYDNAGTSYKTTAAYVLSKDKEALYFLELDSTSLDANDKSNEDVFKKITDSFKYIEK